jgi:uncharacterized protein YlaN (UPF0358 family)
MKVLKFLLKYLPPPTCTLFSEEISTEIFGLFEKIVQSEASNEIQNADPSKFNISIRYSLKSRRFGWISILNFI